MASGPDRTLAQARDQTHRAYVRWLVTYADVGAFELGMQQEKERTLGRIGRHRPDASDPKNPAWGAYWK